MSTARTGIRALRSPQHWKLRTRLVAILVVPAALAVALAVLRIEARVATAAEQDRVVQLVRDQEAVTALLATIQQERLDAVRYVVGNRTGDRRALDATAADGTAATTDRLVDALVEDDPGSAPAPDRQKAADALDRLSDVRDLAVSTAATPSTVVRRYTEIVAQLILLDSTLLREMNSPEVLELASQLARLADAREELTLQRAWIDASTTTAEPSGTALTALVLSDARLVEVLADFRGTLDRQQRLEFAPLVSGRPSTARQITLQGLVLSDPSRPVPAAAAQQAAPDLDRFLEEIDGSDRRLRAQLVATSLQLSAESRALALLDAVLLLLALAVGTLVVGVLSRSMLRGLRTLRLSALEIAGSRLPAAVRGMRRGDAPPARVEPVPVHTREEIGQVARAFDAVHTEAVRLAAEQAGLHAQLSNMFVNLSRRSTILVDRQLLLIEQLEGVEQDPDQLGQLFLLDHLATRMRRNSENLLVLAGAGTTSLNRPAVPLIDVLQAALSEVEHYERIDVERPPAVEIAGRVANDLQHLLAELLENATRFSAPETRVRMSARFTVGDAIVVEITDRGIGLSPERLAEANATLDGAGGISVASSRQMGLSVVGRLAGRHGVRVRLDAQGDGTTARVVVPSAVALVNEADAVATMVRARRRAADPAPAPTPAAVPAQRGAPGTREGAPDWFRDRYHRSASVTLDDRDHRDPPRRGPDEAM